jgi:hypothetical protein
MLPKALSICYHWSTESAILATFLEHPELLRSEMKRNGSEIFFASMRKKCFFRFFRIDEKRRNLKRNENGTKRKQNEKEAKKCYNFRFEAK